MRLLDEWNDLLRRRKNLVGGQLEHFEFPLGTFRGPITAITIVHNELLVIVTEWTACITVDQANRPLSGSQWTNDVRPGATRAEYSIVDSLLSPPTDFGEGCVYFRYGFAHVTIFPKGGRQLDQADVYGL